MRFIWLLILCTVLRAGDCVPLTFDTISGCIGQKISYDFWEKEVKGSTWGDYLDAWNKKFMLYQLKCVYSNIHNKIAEDQEIVYGEPYIWIGVIPKELQANPLNTDDGHCAILYLGKEEAVLIHTLEPNKFYIEHIKLPDLLKRTYLVYKVGGLGIGRVSIPKV